MNSYNKNHFFLRYVDISSITKNSFQPNSLECTANNINKLLCFINTCNLALEVSCDSNLYPKMLRIITSVGTSIDFLVTSMFEIGLKLPDPDVPLP